MCYKFAQEEEEITRPCKHIFSFKCDFHKAFFSMWDFLPSLRLRIFSALVGDFSENLKEKLARVQKKEKRLRYFLRKISGEEKLKMSDGRSTPGSGISVRICPGKSQQNSRNLLFSPISHLTMIMTSLLKQARVSQSHTLNVTQSLEKKEDDIWTKWRGMDNNMYIVQSGQNPKLLETWRTDLVQGERRRMSSGNSEGRDGAGEQVNLYWEQNNRKRKIILFWQQWMDALERVLYQERATKIQFWKCCFGTVPNICNLESGAGNKDAPDSVEAVLSGCETKQEGQVHQGIFIQIQIQIIWNTNADNFYMVTRLPR